MDCGGFGGFGGFDGGSASAPSIVSGRHEGPRPGRWFGDGSWFAGRGGTAVLSTVVIVALVLLFVLA